MLQLTDFLPDDVAQWLDGQRRSWHAMRIDGPSGSGKTSLLTTLVTYLRREKDRRLVRRRQVFLAEATRSSQ